MTNEASPSNPSCIVDVGPHIIGPNIVTVKMSGKNKYNLWRLQMECLLKSQHMVGFINGQSPSPAENGKGKGKEGDMEAWDASDSLVKGWILGSLSEEVARKAVNHLTHMQKNTDFSAKDLWEELQRSYGPSVVAFQKKSCGPSVREQAAETKSPTRQAESVIEVSSISEDAKSKEGSTEFKMTFLGRFLFDLILQGMTTSVINNLQGINPWDKLTNNGNTILHVAVASSTKNHELLKKLLELTPEKFTRLDSDGNEIQNTLLDLVNSDGSSLLHVAAIGDNIKAINMLVERNPELLLATDNEGHIPLALSVSNMLTETSHCLCKHMKAKGYDALFTGKSGEELVVLAISSQDFRLANMIIKDHPDAILSDTDAVLTALAQNFPRDLNFWERGWREEYTRIAAYHTPTLDRFLSYVHSSRYRLPIKILAGLLYLLFAGLLFLTTMIYQFCGVFVRLFVKDTSQIHGYARTLLDNVCNNIRNKDFPRQKRNRDVSCTNSIIEATRRNTSTFVRTIMWRFPGAISSTNEDGHNFIQYSVISRSEKIYSLLYAMSEHKNIYKTIKDSFENNLLHLAARLAPINKLNLISGAALQVQRELQWFKEVERFVCPLNRIQKNLDDETPQEVFTREHKGLVIEGEIWIKKTAESYTITAALIITIVFAAAITVPGGNNQESGIPIFTKNIAFKVFVISVAISLFTAVTSLLMFLSILTARFAEQDFLFKLPTKLIIGLAMLFLSTTAMIIAFGATLFLVFGQGNLLMLIPVGALTCLPITSFVTLQCPLIVELISATYGGGIFVREMYGYFY